MQNIPFASSDSGTAADCMGRCVTEKATELYVGRCYPGTRSDLRGCMFWLACLLSLGFTKHRIRRWQEVKVSSFNGPGTGQAFNSLELGEMENPDSFTDQGANNFSFIPPLPSCESWTLLARVNQENEGNWWYSALPRRKYTCINLSLQIQTSIMQ